MPKVRVLVILLIVTMTIVLGGSWRTVGASNAANQSGSSPACCAQSCCDDDDHPQPALNSNVIDTSLVFSEHEETCDCQCCYPLVGIVQLVIDQRRVKSSKHFQAKLHDQFDARRLSVRLQSFLRPPQRPPGAHTSSLLGLSCLLIV